MPKNIPVAVRLKGMELYVANSMSAREIDAVKAADVGIQGERRVLEGLINLQFVQEVMRVLVDEIDDGELLAKIANKLKILVSTEEQNADRSSNS